MSDPLKNGHYHWNTSYRRNQMGGHYLDWENQPRLFKSYDGIEEIPLPRPNKFINKSLWKLVKGPVGGEGSNRFTQADIGKLLYLSGGITAESRHGGQSFYYRATASAGALYPAEIYATVFDSPDLESGVYHFGPDRLALTRLRDRGDIGYEVETEPSPLTAALPMLSFYLTGIFFRSAWKYRARAYRYVLLDTGHLLENLLLALALHNADHSIHYRFYDDRLALFLGLDKRREVGLVCVRVGKTNRKVVSNDSISAAALPSQILSASEVAAREVEYDDILNAHRAGIRRHKTVRCLGKMAAHIGVQATQWKSIPQTQASDEEWPHAKAVAYRRSKRNYISRPLEYQTFMRLLDLLCRSHGQDSPEDRFSGLAVGFLSGTIAEVGPGFYLLDPEKRRYGLVDKGDLIPPMTAVCLNQQWLSHAAVHFLFMTDLNTLQNNFGPRGYRYAMLNAGRLGQLIYLGATASGIGACGIGALYDFEAQQLLGLNTQSALLYLVAAGPVKRL